MLVTFLSDKVSFDIYFNPKHHVLSYLTDDSDTISSERCSRI